MIVLQGANLSTARDFSVFVWMFNEPACWLSASKKNSHSRWITVLLTNIIIVVLFKLILLRSLAKYKKRKCKSSVKQSANFLVEQPSTRNNLTPLSRSETQKSVWDFNQVPTWEVQSKCFTSDVHSSSLLSRSPPFPITLSLVHLLHFIHSCDFKICT